MTRVDEIDKQDHMNMKMVEFIEAIGWVVDKINLPVLSEQLVWENEEGKQFSLKDAYLWDLDKYLVA